MTAREAVRLWALTRLAMLALLVIESNILDDPRYYARRLDQLSGAGGAADTLTEYPLPALAVLLPPWWVAGGDRNRYLVSFVLLMLAVDAAFAVLLWRAGRGPTPGLRLWLVFAPLLGPLLVTRFDLASAALAAAALVAVAARRPGRAGGLLAAGAAVKVWPAALLPTLLVRRPDRWRALGGFAAVAAVAAAASLAAAGRERLLSPLTWQGDRGLQIESVPALPLMWARVVRPQTWDAEYTRFLTFELRGPGTDLLLGVTSVATAAALVVLGLLVLRAWRSRPGPASVPAVGLLMVVGCVLLIVTNRAFSPQYLVWVVALLAAVGAVAPAEPVLTQANRLLLATCLLTQVVYPLGYGMLTTEAWFTVVGVSLLTVRAGLLVALTVLLARRLVHLTGRVPVPT